MNTSSRFFAKLFVLVGFAACTPERGGTANDAATPRDGSSSEDGSTTSGDGGACVTECALDGIKRCGSSERTVEVCRVTSPGCGSWVAAPSCSSSQFCSAGECVDLCIRGQIDKSTYCDQLRMATCATVVRCCSAGGAGCSRYGSDERTNENTCSNSNDLWGAECPNAITLPVACQEDVLDCANEIFTQDCAAFLDGVLPSTCDTAWLE